MSAQVHAIDEAGTAGQALTPRQVGHRLLVFAAALTAVLLLGAGNLGDAPHQAAESIQGSGQGINTAASHEDRAFADEGGDHGPYTQQKDPYLANASNSNPGP